MLIDSLVIGIRADTEQLKKGLSEAKREISQLDKTNKDANNSINSNLSTSAKSSKDFGTGLKDVNRELKNTQTEGTKLTSVLANLKQGWVSMFASALAGLASIKATTGFADLAHNIGVVSDEVLSSVEGVSGFNNAVKAMGLSANGVNSSLMSLSSTMVNSLRNIDSAQARAFRSLGINLTTSDGKLRGAVEVMQDLQQVISGLSTLRQKAIFSELGINDLSIQTMLSQKKSLKELIELEKQKGVITKEAVAISNKYKQVMSEFSASTQRVLQTASIVILPILTKLFDGFNSISAWVTNNESLVIVGLTAIATVLTATLAPAIASILGAIKAFATSPLIASLVGVGVALGLAVEDIYRYIKGDKSLIGALEEASPAFARFLSSVKSTGDAVALIFHKAYLSLLMLKQGITGDFTGATNTMLELTGLNKEYKVKEDATDEDIKNYAKQSVVGVFTGQKPSKELYNKIISPTEEEKREVTNAKRKAFYEKIGLDAPLWEADKKTSYHLATPPTINMQDIGETLNKVKSIPIEAMNKTVEEQKAITTQQILKQQQHFSNDNSGTVQITNLNVNVSSDNSDPNTFAKEIKKTLEDELSKVKSSSGVIVQ